HHDSVGQADRIGVLVRQPLHVADHVVAQEAEHAGRHRRQSRGQLHLAFADQRAQRVQRPALDRLEGMRIDAGVAIDLGLVPGAAPDHVRLEADDRVAAAHRAALYRFQQEGVGPAVGQLEIGGDRRFEVGDQFGPDELRLAPVIGTGEGVELGRDGHVYCCCCCDWKAAVNTSSFTDTPYLVRSAARSWVTRSLPTMPSSCLPKRSSVSLSLARSAGWISLVRTMTLPSALRTDATLPTGSLNSCCVAGWVR